MILLLFLGYIVILGRGPLAPGPGCRISCRPQSDEARARSLARSLGGPAKALCRKHRLEMPGMNGMPGNKKLNIKEGWGSLILTAEKWKLTTWPIMNPQRANWLLIKLPLVQNQVLPCHQEKGPGA